VYFIRALCTYVFAVNSYYIARGFIFVIRLRIWT